VQLRNHVEWALHCCAVLAAVPQGHFLPAKVLAELHGVPKEYLAKALQALSLAGLVEGSLGPAGGYRLKREPSQITFLDVVEAVEGKASTFVCTEIRGNNPCFDAGYCPTKPCGIARVMWQADKAWRDSLRSVRLSDTLTTLMEDVSAEQLAKTAAWVAERS
jgi:Rrf2 family protein